jgi:hypothetical protein
MTRLKIVYPRKLSSNKFGGNLSNHIDYKLIIYKIGYITINKTVSSLAIILDYFQYQVFIYLFETTLS